ncbi:MAG: winged helix-turn-helix domain-containing protein [Planctomycetota bacterium]
MKQEQIEIGKVYEAKITNRVVPVRIDAVRINLSTGKTGGWDATNLKTNKKVVIKSAQKLRKQVDAPSKEPGKPKAAATSGGVKKKLTAAERRARLVDANTKPKASKATADKPVATKKSDTPQEKRLSLIDAAVRVLGDAKEPLGCKQMVERIVERDLWSPRSGGKTPHATLYSAILRDIQKHGDDARFTKVDRGQFTLATGTEKGA